MREALGSLTTRGQAFLAAGVAASLCAVLLGQSDLLRVGVLLAALPLVAAYVVGRARYSLASGRRIEPARAAAGQPARAVLRLENPSRLPTGLLLLEDAVPARLGGPVRLTLERLEARGRREVAYPLGTARRGRYEVGPLSLRLRDPFGLVERTRWFTAVTPVTITPAVEALPAVGLGGAWAGRGESRARSVASAGEDDVAPREYRMGDDVRRVDWRATAKVGELMVRREEQPWESRAVLLLDTRSTAHTEPLASLAATFERAVSVAASIAAHLARAGYGVDLVTAAGPTAAEGSPGSDAPGLVLDALAVVEPSAQRHLAGQAPSLRRLSGDGLLVAVLGALDPAEAEQVGRMRRSGSAAIAVLVEPDRPSPQAEASAAALIGLGWRVLRLGPFDSLAAGWPAIARAPMAAGSR